MDDGYEKRIIAKKQINQYGVAGYATKFTFTLVTLYGLYFFTDVVGISAVAGSTILMIGTLWDAFTDPLIGVWSDSRTSKKGRRRPVMLCVAVPFGVASWLLFTDFELSRSATVVYFTVLIMIYFSAQTLLDISYTSLGAEMVSDYDVRSRLSNARGIWGCLAGISASFVLVITDWLDQQFANIHTSWSVMAAGFGFLCTISILYTWRKTVGLEDTGDAVHKINREPFRVRDLVEGPLKNKSFLSVMGMFSLAIIAQAFFSACIVYYEINNMQMTNLQITISSLLLYVAGFASLPLIEKVSVKYGKKASWNLYIGIMIVSICTFYLIILQPGRNWGVYLNAILTSAAFQEFYIIPWAMIPDTIEVDEYTRGKRQEGLYYGMVSCVQKVGGALAISASGIFVTYIGYDATLLQQSERTLLGLRNICSIGTAIPLAISIVFAILNPMTKEVHQQLLDGIAQRKTEGSDWKPDVALIKKLRFGFQETEEN